MNNVVVAAIQIACTDDLEENLAKIERYVIAAAKRGAKLVVLQELFEGPYFCKDIDPKHKARAKPFAGHPTIARLSVLAREVGVVLPVSFYEVDGEKCYNTLAMVDGPVPGLVGIGRGVISGLFNEPTRRVRSCRWRSRHDEKYIIGRFETTAR